MSKNKPYYSLNKWERIIDMQLLILAFVGIIALITVKVGGDTDMLIDILINIGCTVVTTIALSIFIYFKYLKRIPEENKKRIEELLDTRLKYESSNHNATLQSLNPDNKHLSFEHSQIANTINAINTSIIKQDAEQRVKYSILEHSQKSVVDSVSQLNCFSQLLQEVNYKNTKLQEKVTLLERENEDLKEKVKQRSERQKTRTDRDSLSR